MILGIDIGNTNIVASLIDGQGVIEEERYETIKNGTDLYHEDHLRNLIKDKTVCGVIISSVVPEINEQIEEASINILGITPTFVSSKLKTGVDIKYDNPNKLGADLITVAVGALTKYSGPLIIIDIGTATTFSVISENNEYLGGMIAPGPHTSIKALASMTSQLPEIEVKVPDKVIGTNTIDCMRIGTITAHAAMIDGMIDKVIKELNVPHVNIIATGGESKDIINMCTHKIILDNNLIPYGLYEIYKKNNNI